MHSCSICYDSTLPNPHIYPSRTTTAQIWARNKKILNRKSAGLDGRQTWRRGDRDSGGGGVPVMGNSYRLICKVATHDASPAGTASILRRCWRPPSADAPTGRRPPDKRLHPRLS
eukprot:scaffold1118_cov127-Isochrysis_galbana.AAC.3